jgi:hypothetical protein
MLFDLQHATRSAPQAGQADALHWQVPPLQTCPAAQANEDPQPPQLAVSVCSSTHAPLQAE